LNLALFKVPSQHVPGVIEGNKEDLGWDESKLGSPDCKALPTDPLCSPNLGHLKDMVYRVCPPSNEDEGQRIWSTTLHGRRTTCVPTRNRIRGLLDNTATSETIHPLKTT